MEADNEHEKRMAALSKRLRHLWPKTKTAVVDDIITEENLREGEKIVFGKLHGSPEVNFQAFQATMKKAWKSENVVCEQLLPGLFQFIFPSILEKVKILEAGPWSFARHVLVLVPWEPGLLPQCIKFDTCAFWMHIHGLPVEGRKEEVIRSIAENVGKVTEVRVEAKGYSALSVGKAKVKLNLSKPLESGLIYSFKGREHWLDFRFERLPVFCYSCGKLGHYAQKCNEIQYDEEFLAKNENLLYGPWLKTEHNTFSPFWKSFYEEPQEVVAEEEDIPDTPMMPEQVNLLQIVLISPQEDRGKRKMIDSDQMNVPYPSPTKENLMADKSSPLMIELPSTKQGYDSLQKTKCISKGRDAKKVKRFSPYKKQDSEIQLADEAELLETQVLEVGNTTLRAMVAGPNKPPGYK